ncbi:hypothetical protein GCM10009665_16180 [Kitasatospora nipponensis]|uniref:ribose-phosphate diphosphokinase n=1 Tax=Kitasatospora nipponensis TaxID=258049 RepID=A0ABN1VY27_9ACTN
MSRAPGRRPLLLPGGPERAQGFAAELLATGRWEQLELGRARFGNGNVMYWPPPGAVPRSPDLLWPQDLEPGQALLELGLALDCLWRARPGLRARILLPYLPYSRSSRVEQGSSLGAAVLLRLLDALPGVDGYAVFDLHTPELTGFARQSLTEHSALADVRAWAAGLAGLDLVVAPDRGRAATCERLARDLGVSAEVLLKRRTDHGDRAHRIPLERPALRGADVLLLDDELTSGSTMTAALETLRESGAARAHLVALRSFADERVVKELVAHPLVHTLATTALSPHRAAEAVRAHGGRLVPLTGALAALADHR